MEYLKVEYKDYIVDYTISSVMVFDGDLNEFINIKDLPVTELNDYTNIRVCIVVKPNNTT